jgi:hypothetical protein
MPNWMKSVTRTPHKPDVAANATFSTAQITSVCVIGQPSTTFAIFTAARFTDAMMKQLNTSPRYAARNPRTNDAAFPEYRIS